MTRDRDPHENETEQENEQEQTVSGAPKGASSGGCQERS